MTSSSFFQQSGKIEVVRNQAFQFLFDSRFQSPGGEKNSSAEQRKLQICSGNRLFRFHESGIAPIRMIAQIKILTWINDQRDLIDAFDIDVDLLRII